MSNGILPAIFALFLLLCFSAGCQFIPKTEHVAEDTIEWSDGTVSEKGTKTYIDAAGKGTADPVGPDGKPNKPRIVDDIKKVENYADKGTGVAEKLPGPFGWIASLLVGTAGIATVSVLKKKRDKKLAADGGKKKT